MTSADLLPAAVLKRKAVVYVRQSTQAQVQTNLESQRRQYDLVDVARQRGFRDIVAAVIDYTDGELESLETVNWFPKVYRKDYKFGLNLTGAGVDDCAP